MQKYACYQSLYDEKHDLVKWLFEILREYDLNMKAKFLFYTLGFFHILFYIKKYFIFRLL